MDDVTFELNSKSIGDDGLIVKKTTDNCLVFLYPNEDTPRAVLWWEYQGDALNLRRYGDEERPDKVALRQDTAIVFLGEEQSEGVAK